MNISTELNLKITQIKTQLEEYAQESFCLGQQVAASIYLTDGTFISTGVNTVFGNPCTMTKKCDQVLDRDNHCMEIEVSSRAIHAEIMALRNIFLSGISFYYPYWTIPNAQNRLVLFCTHMPCMACFKTLKAFGIKFIITFDIRENNPILSEYERLKKLKIVNLKLLETTHKEIKFRKIKIL
jgi:deoxycytidylate deaminase